MDDFSAMYSTLSSRRTRQRGYDIGLACKNGHGINGKATTNPEFNTKFCSKCGEETLSQCECGEPLRGGLLNVASSYDPPAHCTGCGKPHVWTTRRAEALTSLIAEVDEFSPEETKTLTESVPDLMVETPKTEVAVIRFKKAIGRLGPAAANFVKDALKEILIGSVLKKMGL